MSIKVLSVVVAYILSIAAAIKAVDSETVIVYSSGETSLDTVADNLQEAYVEKVAVMKNISILEAEMNHAARRAVFDKSAPEVTKCFKLEAYVCTGGLKPGGSKAKMITAVAELEAGMVTEVLYGFASKYTATRGDLDKDKKFVVNPNGDGWKFTELYKDKGSHNFHMKNGRVHPKTLSWTAFAKLRDANCEWAGLGASMPDCGSDDKHPGNEDCWKTATTDCAR